MRSDFSNTVTLWPARLSCAAAARPAGPEPTMATFFHVRVGGGSGTIQPSSNARSTIAELDRLDGDRVLVDPEHARPFARRGTQQAGELRKVVGLVEPLDRRAPRIAVDQIVPVGDQVAERAALMTERHAAVHAARGLARQVLDRIRLVDVPIVADALFDRARGRLGAREFDEAGRLTHGMHRRNSKLTRYSSLDAEASFASLSACRASLRAASRSRA